MKKQINYVLTKLTMNLHYKDTEIHNTIQVPTHIFFRFFPSTLGWMNKGVFLGSLRRYLWRGWLIVRLEG